MAIGNVMEAQTVDVMFSVEGTLEKNITVTVSIIGGGKYTLNFILVQLNIIMQSFSFVVIIQISWAAFCFACKLAAGIFLGYKMFTVFADFSLYPRNIPAINDGIKLISIVLSLILYIYGFLLYIITFLHASCACMEFLCK